MFDREIVAIADPLESDRHSCGRVLDELHTHPLQPIEGLGLELRAHRLLCPVQERHLAGERLSADLFMPLEIVRPSRAIDERDQLQQRGGRAETFAMDRHKRPNPLAERGDRLILFRRQSHQSRESAELRGCFFSLLRRPPPPRPGEPSVVPSGGCGFAPPPAGVEPARAQQQEKGLLRAEQLRPEPIHQRADVRPPLHRQGQALAQTLCSSARPQFMAPARSKRR